MKVEKFKSPDFSSLMIRFTDENRGEFAVWHGEKVSICFITRSSRPNIFTLSPITVGWDGTGLDNKFWVAVKLGFRSFMVSLNVRRQKYGRKNLKRNK